MLIYTRWIIWQIKDLFNSIQATDFIENDTDVFIIINQRFSEMDGPIMFPLYDDTV